MAVVSLLVVLSCSSTQQASRSDSRDSGPFPGWYSSGEMTATPSGFSAYGTAVAADSAAARRKAVTQALVNLEQHLSARLESIRKEAIRSDSDGNGSGLDSASFIFALRNAEGGISGLATPSRVQAAPNRGLEGYRGFAEVTLSRKELMAYLDSEFGSGGSAWQTLKASKAFADGL
ncbi:MAG: hypothetical protein R3224_00030 [Balneolaceae bacterium]|nr:hypothetical protein [Balneolaceae bacterium]